MHIPFDLLPWINLVGFAVNGFLYVKRGTSQATKDLIDLQEKQIKALKDDAEITRQHGHELGNQIQVLSGKVGKLEGQLSEKQRQLADYRAIFQNRDPELIKVLGEIKDFMQIMAKKFEEYGKVGD